VQIDSRCTGKEESPTHVCMQVIESTRIENLTVAICSDCSRPKRRRFLRNRTQLSRCLVCKQNIEREDVCPMFECYTCQRSIHEPSFECGASEEEKAFTMMEVSGTRRWLCPFCRLEITMAVARNLLDEEDEEPEQRDDWEDSTCADTEDNEEAKGYSHRRGYAAITIRSLLVALPLLKVKTRLQLWRLKRCQVNRAKQSQLFQSQRLQ
jgi:hypothetical protein